MRTPLCLTLVALACATPARQGPPAAAVSAPPTAAALAPPVAPAWGSAKAPRDPTSTLYTFEGVEVIGSRRYPKAELLAVIGMPKPGTEVDVSQDGIDEEIEASTVRLKAKYSFAHCRYNLTAFPPTGTARITVDLVDAGDEWRLDFLPQPTTEVSDPEGLIAAWKASEKERGALRKKGEVQVYGEPTCRALACVAHFGHPRLAVLEERFLEGVPRNYPALVRVLREDNDEFRRMTAASLLVYGRSREEAVAALLPSVRDPSHSVRNEVLRSLGELQHRQKQLVLPLEPILDALWYPSTNDRNKAAVALVRIVEATGSAHKRLILERSGEMLAMMAGLKTFTDYGPALQVLETLSGRRLGADETAWRAWLVTEGVAPRKSSQPAE
jgi:hypothetical protein